MQTVVPHEHDIVSRTVENRSEVYCDNLPGQVFLLTEKKSAVDECVSLEALGLSDKLSNRADTITKLVGSRLIYRTLDLDLVLISIDHLANCQRITVHQFELTKPGCIDSIQLILNAIPTDKTDIRLICIAGKSS